MKKLTYCPICRTRLKRSSNSASCNVGYAKERTHEFMFDLSLEDRSKIIYLWFSISSMLVVFNVADKKIALTNMDAIPTITQGLPFFEPDFSDMDALISKLKLYAMFS